MRTPQGANSWRAAQSAGGILFPAAVPTLPAAGCKGGSGGAAVMLPIALMKGKVDAGFFQPTIRGDSPQQPVMLTISPRLILKLHAEDSVRILSLVSAVGWLQPEVLWG